MVLYLLFLCVSLSKFFSCVNCVDEEWRGQTDQKSWGSLHWQVPQNGQFSFSVLRNSVYINNTPCTPFETHQSIFRLVTVKKYHKLFK